MTKAGTAKDEIIQKDILQAALQLFQKYGLNKVTMDDVAKAVGKGRSSLYYYYKSREEIFEAVMEATIGEIIREISEAVQQGSSVEQKIHAFCWMKLKTSEERQAFYRALENGMGAEEMSKHRAAMTTFHLHLMERESAILRQVLEEAAESKAIKPITKKEMDLHIFVLLSSIRGIKREVLLKGENYKDIKSVVFTLGHMLIKSLT